MNIQRIVASALVHAPAEEVYAILADYRAGHPRILPAQYFACVRVEQGGTGAGTQIRFQMRAFGAARDFRAAITEPEPGRVLMETAVEVGPAGADQKAAAVTIFTVIPREAGRSALVTIATALPARERVTGWAESFFTAEWLRRVYAQELKLLAAAAETHSPALA
jgi:hypothetical protein